MTAKSWKSTSYMRISIDGRKGDYSAVTWSGFPDAVRGPIGTTSTRPSNELRPHPFDSDDAAHPSCT
jgi:hypothetical protein